MLVVQEFMCTEVSRSSMSFKVLGPCSSAAESSKLRTCIVVSHFLIGDSAQEFPYPESSSISSGFSGWQDMIRADTLRKVSQCSVGEAQSGQRQCSPSRSPGLRTLSPYDTQVPSPKKMAPKFFIFCNASRGF